MQSRQEVSLKFWNMISETVILIAIFVSVAIYWTMNAHSGAPVDIEWFFCACLSTGGTFAYIILNLIRYQPVFLAYNNIQKQIPTIDCCDLYSAPLNHYLNPCKGNFTGEINEATSLLDHFEPGTLPRSSQRDMFGSGRSDRSIVHL